MTKKTKRSPLSAEDNEQQYRIVFESASDGMIISDLETGRVVDANPSAIAMHGYTREEFIGLHLSAYIHPDSQRLFAEDATDSKKGGAFIVPAVHLHKDGSTFCVDVRRTKIPFQARPCRSTGAEFRWLIDTQIISNVFRQVSHYGKRNYWNS